jgi:PhnB protein
MTVQPYVFFDGRCDEALDFYKKTLKAEVTNLIRYEDVPGSEAMAPPNSAGKVLHASFRVGESNIDCSDGMCGGAPTFTGVSLGIVCDDDADAERTFSALADGGNVTQPLIPTFFSTRFGMLTDRFGLGWMVLSATRPA